ncbi:uncharacterized protein [Bombus fervidus]|uniref:uncharacterized protein n=1 Tax=Bombus fervidus TaxID=203811 RepID=UPI003D18B588
MVASEFRPGNRKCSYVLHLSNTLYVMKKNRGIKSIIRVPEDQECIERADLNPLEYPPLSSRRVEGFAASVTLKETETAKESGTQTKEEQWRRIFLESASVSLL